MGNTLSIAAVTAALRNRLDAALGDDLDLTGMDVRTRPMDQAFETPSGTEPVGNCLNIFLYHVVPSAPFRNRGAPLQVKPGETGSPPLGLTLHYLISAHGAAGDDVLAHRILGKAMACLHDQPLLTASELAAFTGGDLHLQVERVRITEQPLTTEEMYKLWSAFQTHYRVSAAYEVSVVMIDSARPIKAPLPALRLLSPSDPDTANVPKDFVLPRLDLYPTLTAVTPSNGRDYALIGDSVIVSGSHLTDDADATVTALLSHPLLPATVRLPIMIDEDGVITVAVPTEYPLPPAAPAFSLPAGFYTLALEIAPTTGPTVVTNAIPFVVAPKIDFVLNPPSVTHNAEGIPVVNVTVEPPVWQAQHVYFLLGSQGFPADPLPSSENTTVTCTADVPVDDYYLRIRVDGVDSSLIDESAPNPPAFVVTRKVTITAAP